MSGDNEIETFRRFFANMETRDLMKGFLKSMEGKPTPKKLEILIATLKNFDYLYKDKSEKVKENVRYRMMGAMDYLLSREEDRKEARANKTHHKVELRKLRLEQRKEDEYNREMERRERLNKSDSRVVTVRAPSASMQNTSRASKQSDSPGVTVRAPLASKRNTSQASKQSDSPDVVTVLQPSSLSEEALSNVRKAQHSDHEQEEEKTGCYSIQCPFMGGNKSRKTRRIRKTKKYKKRKTRKNTKNTKNTKKRKTNQKRKTRGGKKNKRKKKQTRKR